MIGFSEDAATPYGAGLDKTSFFAWVQRQDGGRYELKDGRIVMHAGSTKRHSWVSAGFISEFRRALDLDIWAICTDDVAIELGHAIRYPDVMVERRTDDGSSLSTVTPVVIVEVLSPSSSARDLVEKRAEYTSLSSVDCYIVASQDEPIVWIWQRDADTGGFPILPAELAGRDAKITLPSLAIELPLAEIYRGIGEKAPR